MEFPNHKIEKELFLNFTLHLPMKRALIFGKPNTMIMQVSNDLK